MPKLSSSKAPEHLRFAVLATDTILFTIRDSELCVRLIPINRPPHYQGTPGLPGGLLLPTETAEEATVRHLREKARVSDEKMYIEQLYTFSALERDERGRVVAVAYLALIPWSSLSDEERLDTTDSWWQEVKGLRSLAFDHDEMLAIALTRLRSRVTYTTLISKLLPAEFTLTELEQTYESILRSDLDKRNFRKKVLKLGIVTALGKKRSTGRSRPAELYRFTSKRVIDIEVL